jgi:hypothetical protein
VLEDAHKTHVLDIKAASSEPEAVAVDVTYGLEVAFAFEAGVARLLAFRESAEERLKRFIEAPERLLYRRVIEPGNVLVKAADLLELIGLVSVADAHTATLPRLFSFLKGGVVELAVGLQNAVQRPPLLRIGVKPVLEAADHLISTEVKIHNEEPCVFINSLGFG